ncbi:hypothetical protein FH972_025172 [Carpinus fangiana]|uniref:Apple domain-containing protein n=1 Tax=Carpinus fangiana TaxID=176857 RepID=A0A5N6L089_9ROSI|nr:hypothetical protein FH972_025172 [Carpinus fangiana]
MRPLLRSLILCISALTGITIISRGLPQPLSAPQPQAQQPLQQNSPENIPANPSIAADFICPSLELANDVVLVLKTGGTEAARRLPAYYETFLKCVPQYEVYSDVEDEINGHHVQNALDEIDDSIKQRHSDFKLYFELQDSKALGGDLTGVRQKAYKKEEGDGWKLDKWKFLPMVQKVSAKYPDTPWFFFLEADSYLIWPNLLLFLAQISATSPLYIGAGNIINGPTFAHGGSGWIMSNPAIKTAVHQIESSETKYNDLVEEEACGDNVLGKVMDAAGVGFTSASEHLQNETPTTANYGYFNWCYAAMTFHHLSSEETRELWSFQQAHRSAAKDDYTPILYRDVFRHFHNMSDFLTPRQHWNNRPTGRVIMASNAKEGKTDAEVSAHVSVDACRDFCTEDTGCMQYSYAPGKCTVGNGVRFGSPTDRNVISGWMHERVVRLVHNTAPCNPQWKLP